MCNYQYCTDCKQSHPGYICRGIPPEDDPDIEAQSCPGCFAKTYKRDGCPCMKCGNPSCGKIWCWTCRCLRHPETRYDKPHYCPTDLNYRSNPAWGNHFVPYRRLEDRQRSRFAEDSD